MYGRKEEDDAPQEQAASSSNGVRHLPCSTVGPKWHTVDLTVPMFGQGSFPAANLITPLGMQAPQQQTSEKEDDDDDGLDDLFAE